MVYTKHSNCVGVRCDLARLQDCCKSAVHYVLLIAIAADCQAKLASDNVCWQHRKAVVFCMLCIRHAGMGWDAD